MKKNNLVALLFALSLSTAHAECSGKIETNAISGSIAGKSVSATASLQSKVDCDQVPAQVVSILIVNENSPNGNNRSLSIKFSHDNTDEIDYFIKNNSLYITSHIDDGGGDQHVTRYQVKYMDDKLLVIGITLTKLILSKDEVVIQKVQDCNLITKKCIAATKAGKKKASSAYEVAKDVAPIAFVDLNLNDDKQFDRIFDQK